MGSDAKVGKFTFASLLGVDHCEKLVLEHTQKAKDALAGAVPDTGFLDWLADHLAVRRN